jgi:hypothetical protein
LRTAAWLTPLTAQDFAIAKLNRTRAIVNARQMPPAKYSTSAWTACTESANP